MLLVVNDEFYDWQKLFFFNYIFIAFVWLKILLGKNSLSPKMKKKIPKIQIEKKFPLKIWWSFVIFEGSFLFILLTKIFVISLRSKIVPRKIIFKHKLIRFPQRGYPLRNLFLHEAFRIAKLCKCFIEYINLRTYL